MTKQDFLHMRWLIRKLPDIGWDVAQKNAIATKSTTVITGMPRGGGNHDQMADATIMLAAARDAYREVLSELESMQEKLSPMIDALEDPNERAVMRMRYLHRMSPDEIAGLIFRTDRMVYIYLNRAEKKIIRMSS